MWWMRLSTANFAPLRYAERLPEPRYDSATLPFKPWSLQEMLTANQVDLEQFLTHIYRAIASAAPLKVG